MENALILTPPSTRLRGILLSVRTMNSPERPEYEKNINTISTHGEKFYQLHTDITTAVATSKLSGKSDPSEIERTYNLKKKLADDIFRTNIGGIRSLSMHNVIV